MSTYNSTYKKKLKDMLTRERPSIFTSEHCQLVHNLKLKRRNIDMCIYAHGDLEAYIIEDPDSVTPSQVLLDDIPILLATFHQVYICVNDNQLDRYIQNLPVYVGLICAKERYTFIHREADFFRQAKPEISLKELKKVELAVLLDMLYYKSAKEGTLSCDSLIELIRKSGGQKLAEVKECVARVLMLRKTKNKKWVTE